ncbi:hypothetical protein D5F52_05330 [Brevibacillus laterosporus]|nr:hypothetical protein D5F52_05330 [Brevibacillus laterosporus]
MYGEKLSGFISTIRSDGGSLPFPEIMRGIKYPVLIRKESAGALFIVRNLSIIKSLAVLGILPAI